MKKLFVLTLVGMMSVACTSRTEKKYDKKRLDIQKQEAKAMIDKLDGDDEIKIKRSRFGKDKIILDD